MSSGGFRFEPYDWRGGREWMLVRGPSSGPHILVLPPLFEELNFTRTLLGEISRALDRRGIATWLPDLPGTGESACPLAEVSWTDWRDAARAAGDAVADRTGARPFTCAFRGGTLLDDAVAAAGRWRYAPVDGAAQLRQLHRAQLVADREAGATATEAGAVAELAGYPLSLPVREGLAAARPNGTADRELPAKPGAAPWRRAEPAGDSQLAEELAADICGWVGTCASC